MRKIIMSALVGLVALAVVGGNALPVAAASAAPSPRPPGASTVTAFVVGGKISCGSPTSCLAIGDNLSNGADPTPVAEAWNGAAWRSVPVPAPKASVAVLILADVSCRSATSCLVVGVYATLAGTGGERPYALTWNGKSLRPTAALPVPKGDKFASLNGVSCLTVSSCVAVGNLNVDTGHLAVEIWNGAKWTLRTPGIAGGAQFALPSAVSCLSVTSCVVAGQTSPRTGDQRMLLARWNGKSLTAMKAVSPAGAKNLSLSDVSCASAKSCAATGRSANEAGTSGFGFVEVWSGTSWTAHKVAAPKGDVESLLSGVSCRPSGRCVVVGGAITAKASRAMALSFNGKTWSAQPVPAPGTGKWSSFTNVSCPQANECVAIGEHGSTTAGNATSTPLGGVWNGSSWKLAAA